LKSTTEKDGFVIVLGYVGCTFVHILILVLYVCVEACLFKLMTYTMNDI